jgi:hypothetical protein
MRNKCVVRDRLQPSRFQERGRFLPGQTTAVSILDRFLHHATVVITDGQSYRMKDAQHHPQPTQESPHGVGTSIRPGHTWRRVGRWSIRRMGWGWKL